MWEMLVHINGSVIAKCMVTSNLEEMAQVYYRHVKRGEYPYAVVTNGYMVMYFLTCQDDERDVVRFYNPNNHTNQIVQMD